MTNNIKSFAQSKQPSEKSIIDSSDVQQSSNKEYLKTLLKEQENRLEELKLYKKIKKTDKKIKGIKNEINKNNSSIPEMPCEEGLFQRLTINNSLLSEEIENDTYELYIKESSPTNYSGFNPLFFTKFYERRFGYFRELSGDQHGFNSSKYYIRPDSKILINFDQCFLKEYRNYLTNHYKKNQDTLLNNFRIKLEEEYISSKIDSNEIKKQKLKRIEDHKNQTIIEAFFEIEISAYIKTVQNRLIPISVMGYSEVIDDIGLTNGLFIDSKQDTINYNKVNIEYTRRSASTLSETEIDLNEHNFVVGDQVIVLIKNKSIYGDGVGFTMTFEIENQGWQHGPHSNLAFIKAPEQSDVNYRAGAGIGYQFYSGPTLGKRSFLHHLLVPSFGPQFTTYSDSSNEAIFGIGGSVSTLYRSVTLGYGSLLNVEDDRQYFSLGINFIEGIKAISDERNKRVGESNVVVQ